MTITVEPMTFHYPGWTIDIERSEDSSDLYQVWGPGEIHHQGRPTGEVRERWAVSYNSHDSERGFFHRGDTLEQVLTYLPERIAKTFREAIEKS